MILVDWSQVRRHFAAAPTPLDRDGLPFWPGPVLPDQSIDGSGATGLLRANGFSGTVVATTQGGQPFVSGLIGPLVNPALFASGDPVFPISVTCNAGAVDAVPTVHDFKWAVLMRAEPGKHPVLGSPVPQETFISQLIFQVTHANPLASGTIQIALNTGPAALLLPGLSGAALLTADAFQIMCKNVFVYVSRKSDHAFQVYRLYTRGVA